jgi:alpha-soluble NSF attachment protein
MDTKSSDDNFALKGHDFMAKGDKTLKGIYMTALSLGSTFGNMFGSKGERAEKAMELYKQAATQFKLGKKCTLKLNISRV